MLNTIELKLELPSNLTKDEVQTLLAVKLFEIGRVSPGQAARAIQFSIFGGHRPRIKRIKRVGADQISVNPPHPHHRWSIRWKTK